MITVSVGEIRADDAVALYEGDSAFVERLREITAYDAVELADGKYAPVSWTEPGGIRLAPRACRTEIYRGVETILTSSAPAKPKSPYLNPPVIQCA